MLFKYNRKLVVISVIVILLFAAAGFSLGKLEGETPVNIGESGVLPREESAYEETRDMQDDNQEQPAEEKVDAKINPANLAVKVEESQPEAVKRIQVDMTPITTASYTVKSGDTLFLISQRARVTVKHLVSLNGLKNDTIHTGQQLKIKGQVSTANQTASRSGIREDDLYWLSRIIHAEAQGEPYKGKVAVGNVILNRVKSSLFPNNIYGVVFDKQYGYTQFSPVIDGSIYNTPGADSVRAAKDALNGVRPVGDALYFLNPRKATNFWIVKNRKFYMTIGGHDFYH